MRRSPKQLALVLLASILFAATVLFLIPLRTDMAGFLPPGQSAGSRFLLREVRDGVASSFITAGIEGAPVAELARISRDMQATLNRDSRFSAVLNGSFSTIGNETLRDLLFTHRYLLAPDAKTRDFSRRALTTAFGNVLDGLESAAEPLVISFALRDPTGAFTDTLKQLRPDVQAHLTEGVWFASDRAPGQERTLLLFRTKAGGMDFAAQKDAPAAIQAAFAATHPGPARLLLSGPAVLAVQSAQTMRGDIDLITIASILIVTSVLYWRFRSLWVLAAIGAPFLISLGVAMIVVRLCFGSVHGIAFGFGMTMLGVSLDYPVLLIGHRDVGEGPEATLRRIAPSLRLAVLMAALGLSGMILCGLPGLAQLGVFAATGLLTAAAVTLLLMPRLIVAADLAPVISGPSAPLERAERLRRLRFLCAAPVLGALAVLIVRPPALITDLSALSPVPPAARAQEAELRRELGTPQSARLIAVHGDTPEQVLEREEAMHPVLARVVRVVRMDVLSGVQDAAGLVPSVALQHQRQSLLPDDAVLESAIRAAQAGLPFQADSFSIFCKDVAAARTMPPLTAQMLADTPLAQGISPLLFQRDDGWWGLILPADVRNMAVLQSALGPLPGVLVMDLNAELRSLTAYHTRLTLLWSLAGSTLALLILFAVLRDIRRLLKVFFAVGAVMVILPAILALRGEPLSLIHLVSIQFVAGVALDYALFFARPQLDGAERARTIRTLLTCNIMTVLSFGCLYFCHTPLLREIGLTISCGAFLSLLSGFMLAGQKPSVAATDAA
ncbi:MMPL family transporter [Acetobacter fallax]|uniref:MMPL family transporter n=1 Tax=Acetobacter fallax TaxID=1737473 RepID=A0ABX0KG25_9PROT|nr:MMPL family transporter [Acetobacter fallax]NHO34086.1 MMPL family transporter [Acetobacter fallax]NHO37614.1 MMPL family transporter [Acetobacter fallax]